MHLVYDDPEQTVIRATLDEGESLGNLAGPIDAFVPTDPDNTDYAAILEQSLKIDAYQAPAPPPGDAHG